MAPYPVTDLADYLRGAWDLAREIVGVDGSALRTFTGTAEPTLTTRYMPGSVDRTSCISRTSASISY